MTGNCFQYESPNVKSWLETSRQNNAQLSHWRLLYPCVWSACLVTSLRVFDEVFHCGNLASSSLGMVSSWSLFPGTLWQLKHGKGGYCHHPLEETRIHYESRQSHNWMKDFIPIPDVVQSSVVYDNQVTATKQRNPLKPSLTPLLNCRIQQTCIEHCPSSLHTHLWPSWNKTGLISLDSTGCQWRLCHMTSLLAHSSWAC